MTTLDPSVRISAGLAFMDERYPGWRNRINPDTLDVADPCNCILAQATGRDYNEVVPELGLRAMAASRLGIFVIDNSPGEEPSPAALAEYDVLTAGWLEALELQAA